MFIWQTKKWGEMLLQSKQVENIFYIENLQIEKRSIGLKQYGFFILGISLEQIANKNILDKINNLAKKENVLFTQIETVNYNKENNKIYQNLFETNVGYYKKFITPYTAIIDLEKDLEEILAKMKPKGRYNIKLAQKKGVIVRQVKKNNENIKAYYDLMLETTSRDNFSGNSFEYYKVFLNKLENSKLILAYKDEKVIAGGIFIFDEEISIYYYGASTSKKEYRNLMAPYLVQWEAIKIAKEKKSKIFDFLGVANPNNKNDSLKGITDFKRKLTPQIIEVSSSYIFINKKIKFSLFNFIRKIKKSLPY